MKKALAFLLVVFALGFFFLGNGKGERGRRAPASGETASLFAAEAPAAKEKSGGAAAALAAAVAEPAEGRDEISVRAAAPAPPSAETFLEYKGMFAEAPVISSVTEYGPEPGQETVSRVVETSMKLPFVKIREIYEERDGKRILVDQRAMVANQLMLQRPAGVPEEDFFAALRSAGAKEIKPVADAVVVTFESRPHDPKALDDALSRVRAALGVDVVIEPNYIRKLL